MIVLLLKRSSILNSCYYLIYRLCLSKECLIYDVPDCHGTSFNPFRFPQYSRVPRNKDGADIIDCTLLLSGRAFRNEQSIESLAYYSHDAPVQPD